MTTNIANIEIGVYTAKLAAAKSIAEDLTRSMDALMPALCGTIYMLSFGHNGKIQIQNRDRLFVGHYNLGFDHAVSYSPRAKAGEGLLEWAEAAGYLRNISRDRSPRNYTLTGTGLAAALTHPEVLAYRLRVLMAKKD